MAQPQLKLTYFDGTGRAELTRLALHYGGVPFTDERVAHATFAELKPTLPLGQLPVLEVDGKTFSQSVAIARYAAKLAGLYPTDPVEALRVDMIADTFEEIGIPLIDIRFRSKDEADKAEKTKKFLETMLPVKLQALENLVQGKFFLGEKESLADIQLFDVVVNKLQATIPTASIDAYPKLAVVVANVKALPAIATYLAK